MARPKVIVTRRWPAEVERDLQSRYDVVLNEQDVAMSAEQLSEAMRSADAVLPTVTDRITGDVLGANPLRAKFIGNFGVGFNHIDLTTATARGITVTNTPGVLTDCTADLALTLLLMAARRAGEGERHVRAGEWSGWRPTHMIGTQVTGKTLGLIGMGRIGQAVAKRAHFGFGMKIIYASPRPPRGDLPDAMSAQRCSVQELLATADFVSLHCPGGDETRHLIDAEALRLMPNHSILINTARGDVVDSEALIVALREGGIGAAGLDVFEGEPALNQDFLGLESVVLLPHLGSAARETRVAMGRRVLENLHGYFEGQTPRDKLQ